MVYSKITDDMDIIQALPDEPNDVGGLTAAQLKAKFDEAGNKIKAAFNNLVDELNTSGTGASSASEISFRATTGVPEDNVQGAIENVQEQIAGISQGAVADGSITTVKLNDSAVTTAKLADGSVTYSKLASGTIGWRKLTSSEFYFTADDPYVNSVVAVDAYYCEVIGLVRFFASFEAKANSASDFKHPAVYDLLFDETKYYKPTNGENTITGIVNAKFSSCQATANIEKNACVRVYVLGNVSEDSVICVSGLYYTEDIPTGGNS